MEFCAIVKNQQPSPYLTIQKKKYFELRHLSPDPILLVCDMQLGTLYRDIHPSQWALLHGGSRPHHICSCHV